MKTRTTITVKIENKKEWEISLDERLAICREYGMKWGGCNTSYGDTYICLVSR